MGGGRGLLDKAAYVIVYIVPGHVSESVNSLRTPRYIEAGSGEQLHEV